MSNTTTLSTTIKLPDGRVLKRERPAIIHGGSVLEQGEIEYYVNDEQVLFWDYDGKTGIVEIIEIAHDTPNP